MDARPLTPPRGPDTSRGAKHPDGPVPGASFFP